MGTCGCEQAVALRRQWADRMWKEVSQEMTQGKNPLDRRVADAVRRLWSVRGDGRLGEWAPGEVGPIAGLGLGGKLQPGIAAALGGVAGVLVSKQGAR